jgi:hypothetical protein
VPTEFFYGSAPLNDYGHHPRMAHWFNPILLFKLLINSFCHQSLVHTPTGGS